MNTERQILLNLLARIHRDGGHYTETHGLEKSAQDAEEKIVDLIHRINALHRIIVDVHWS